jgi:hypothetical protein
MSSKGFTDMQEGLPGGCEEVNDLPLRYLKAFLGKHFTQ